MKALLPRPHRRGLLPALLLLCTTAPDARGTVVRVSTVLGDIDVQLLDTRTPLTVTNFLAYAQAGLYDGTFVHRSAYAGGRPFVIQGGGYEASAGPPPLPHIPTELTASLPGGFLPNEFYYSNVRGTIAMAKLGGDPDSATSEWFVNMGDNRGPPGFLDEQNGGFTVFGCVSEAGMQVADAIAALPRVPVAGVPAFQELPVLEVDDENLDLDELVVVTAVSVLEGAEEPFPCAEGIPVPEPGSRALCLAALLALGWSRAEAVRRGRS